MNREASAAFLLPIFLSPKEDMIRVEFSILVWEMSSGTDRGSSLNFESREIVLSGLSFQPEYEILYTIFSEQLFVSLIS